MGGERTTLKGMINNEHLPFTSLLDFLIPHAGFKSAWRTICIGSWLGGGFMAKSGGALINIIISILLFFIVYIPVYPGFFFVSFFIASVIRLVRGTGGKSGMRMSLAYIISYILIFRFIYVPFVLNSIVGYVDWGDVMRYFKIY
ncbi:hypothetical protein ACTJNK_13655 [Achromobacter anxifer]|uniref:hypothetical protein n=1 Tax=Alcaligenes xylosoxydans xylosoxydans TaxID=85698 RepID=UPI001040E863|nr:hypothetical protein [Achromobacter xylosoxidans]